MVICVDQSTANPYPCSWVWMTEVSESSFRNISQGPCHPCRLPIHHGCSLSLKSSPKFLHLYCPPRISAVIVESLSSCGFRHEEGLDPDPFWKLTVLGCHLLLRWLSPLWILVSREKREVLPSLLSVDIPLPKAESRPFFSLRIWVRGLP